MLVIKNTDENKATIPCGEEMKFDHGNMYK